MSCPAVCNELPRCLCLEPFGPEAPAEESPGAPVARGRLMSLPYGGSSSPQGRTDLESGRLSTARPRQMSLVGTSPLFDSESVMQRAPSNICTEIQLTLCLLIQNTVNNDFFGGKHVCLW